MAEKVTIRCRENGPLVIPYALLTLTDHKGSAFPLPTNKDNVALCRCGQSKIKPFCDGTHKEIGFQAAELAPPPVAEG